MFVLLFFFSYLTHKHFKQFLFLSGYFERLSITGTNENKQMFSFKNVVIIVLCFILYTFPFLSRIYSMLVVCFIPPLISSNDFVKIRVDVWPPPPRWFNLNTSETVKAVSLAFCSIQ